MVIDTQGLDVPVSSTWYYVWTAVEATVALCVRKGKGGMGKGQSKSSSNILSFHD